MENKYKCVMVRMTKEEMELFDKICKKLNMSRRKFILSKIKGCD